MSEERSTVIEHAGGEHHLLRIDDVKILGEHLRACRNKAGLTMLDASALASVSIQFLHDLETGKETIQMGRALKYAKQLGVQLHVVVQPDPAPEAAPQRKPRRP